jgi:LacI family transcriptional regulator
VPEDIAVVGFNNDTISTISDPQITTVNYPAIKMGEQAAIVLMNHLTGSADASLTNSIVLNSELIIRKSSLKKPSNF